MHALEKQPKRAVIVGAGFIGLEMAENLKKRFRSHGDRTSAAYSSDTG